MVQVVVYEKNYIKSKVDVYKRRILFEKKNLQKSRIDKASDSMWQVILVIRIWIQPSLFVKKVTEGGAADKAGLKANSVITEFNGKAVSSIDQLSEYLSYYEPDEEVELTVQVPHGTSYKEETVKVTLDENTDADDSDDNDKDSKKSKKDSKKSSKDADEDVDEDTDSEDSMDSDDTEESENPFIQYFENQGFFR